MADDLELPDSLEIKHGDDLGEIGPEAKQYYHPDKLALKQNGVHIQRFDYQIPFEKENRGIILLNIAYDEKTRNYYIFIHKAGLSPDHGLVSTLDYEVTITNNGERVKNEGEIPTRVIKVVNDYFTKNHE